MVRTTNGEDDGDARDSGFGTDDMTGSVDEEEGGNDGDVRSTFGCFDFGRPKLLLRDVGMDTCDTFVVEVV